VLYCSRVSVILTTYQCDRGKPACSACKKSNVSHLCTYEEPAWAAYESNDGNGQLNSSSTTSSPAPRSPFTFKPTATATAQIQHHQQQELQQQQLQFQQSLQQQQQYQQALQNQLSAKYGSNGKPLTGAAANAVPAQNPYPGIYGAERYSQPIPQYPFGEYNNASSNVLLPPIANQSYNQLNQHNLQSELEYLRNRIVQIEGNMGVNGQQLPHQPHQQHPHLIQHHQGTQPPYYVPKQLPPQQIEIQQQFPVHQQQQQHQPGSTGYNSNGIQLPSINQIKPLFDPTKDSSQEPRSQGGSISDQLKPNEPQSSSKSNDLNIDPTLIDESEIIYSFKTNAPNSEYLKLEGTGIFEATSYAKKDSFQTNFFLCLKAHEEKLKEPGETGDESGPLRKRIKLNDHFHNLLQNPKYQVETFFKYETNNLNEIIKRISKLLPYKKIVWLLVEKFFTSFADPFIPVLDEEEFLLDITKIIGEKELNDSRIKINADVNNTKDLINLAYLLMILRISTVSLTSTIKLDKFNNFLLKNAPLSPEFDFVIQILLIFLENFNIDKIPRLKLKLLELFLFNKSTETTDVADFYPAGLSVALNLNNKNEIGSNEQLIKIWYHLYFQYYNTNIVKGVPIFLNDEFFNLELSNFKNGNLGLNFHKSILEFYGKQIELNKIIYKIWNKLYNFVDQEVTVGTLEKLIESYDQFVLSNFKDYDTYKKDLTVNYSNKCLNLLNNANHKLTKMNLNCYILIHYESQKTKDKEKFAKVLKHILAVCIESIEKSLDVFKNYNSHFNSGYEFIVFPSLVMLVDKAVKFLLAAELRLWWINKPSLAILKFFVNIVDELKGFTFLDSNYGCWKIKTRLLLFVNLAKESYQKKEGAIPLLAKTINLPGVNEELKFDELYTNFEDFSDKELQETEKELDALNSKFDNNYTNIYSLDEFFEKLDIENPAFDVKYFY